MRNTISQLSVLTLILALAGCTSSSCSDRAVASAEAPQTDARVSGSSDGALVSAPETAICPPANSVATYVSPEAAMMALADGAATGDCSCSVAILGEDCHDLIMSGDDDTDREDFVRTASMIHEELSFEDIGNGRQIAVIGKDAWRFPIPLVASPGGWKFDARAGRDGLLSRRIGRNELLVVDALHACIEAQDEYRSVGRDGKTPAYAQRFASTAGLHDGLYWATRDGESASPMGPYIAAASCDAPDKDAADELVPFHGYYFKMLCGQGKCAAGGEKSYLDKDGLMTHGCAVVAWPATYGQSGVMTFVAREGGVILQRDLGAEATNAKCPLKSFDPEAGWTVVNP